MINPQDIDKADAADEAVDAFDTHWRVRHEEDARDAALGHFRAGYLEGRVAALRAVQEPVAWLHQYKQTPSGGHYECATMDDRPEVPCRAGYEHYRSLPLVVVVATPPPPGAASPGESAQPPNTRLRLTGNQVHELNEFMGGDYGCEIVLGTLPARKSTEGEDMPAGVYVWIGEHPEEGCVLLSPEAEAASPAVPAHGELHPQLAIRVARQCLRYTESFNGQQWDATFDSPDRRNLAVALENLEELAAMTLNLADRVAAPQPPHLPAGWVAVPVEPEPERIESMAIRYDHGHGVPMPVFGPDGFQDEAEDAWRRRQESNRRTMRQLYEEAIGQGFYNDKTKPQYAAALAEALEKP